MQSESQFERYRLTAGMGCFVPIVVVALLFVTSCAARVFSDSDTIEIVGTSTPEPETMQIGLGSHVIASTGQSNWRVIGVCAPGNDGCLEQNIRYSYSGTARSLWPPSADEHSSSRWWSPEILALKDLSNGAPITEVAYFPGTALRLRTDTDLVILLLRESRDVLVGKTRQLVPPTVYVLKAKLYLDGQGHNWEADWNPVLYLTDGALSDECGDKGEVVLTRGTSDTIAKLESIQAVQSPEKYVSKEFVSSLTATKLSPCLRVRPK